MHYAIADEILKSVVGHEGVCGRIDIHKDVDEHYKIGLSDLQYTLYQVVSDGYLKEIASGAYSITQKGRAAAKIGIKKYEANQEDERALQEKADKITIKSFELQKATREENKRSNRRIIFITVATLIVAFVSLIIAALAFYYSFIYVGN